MTIEELQNIIDSTQWKFIGKGNFNIVSVSTENLTIEGYNGIWVLKTPQELHHLSTAARAVRKWNELNPNYPALALKNGWIAPYLGDNPASDEQIAKKLIEIYRRTRNIVGDAGTSGANFLVYQNEVICVDVDQAFRRASFDTEQFGAAHHAKYKVFLNRCFKNGYTQTINVIETLFYLEKNLPTRDIQDIYITPSLIARLHAYRYQQKIITLEILNTLLAIEHLAPENEIDITPLFVETLQPIPGPLSKQLLVTVNKQLKRAQFRDFIQNGNLEIVKILIKHNGALLYQLDKNGFCPIHLAVIHGQIEIVRYLLTQDTYMDRTTGTTANSTTSNMTALDLAIHYGHDTIADLLIEQGAKCKDSSYLIFSAKNNSLDAVKLCVACDSQSIHARDHFNQTALLWAALNGHEDIVSYLISKGANVRIPTQHPGNHVDIETDYYSPLDWAIKGGHRNTILILNEAGASTNHTHYAINNKSLGALILDKDLSLVQILIKNNTALIDQIDHHGYAPLHYAAKFGTIEIANYLITQGANLNAVTATREKTTNIRYSHMTPLDIVVSQKKHDELALLLLDKGATISPGVDRQYHAIHLAAKNGREDLVERMIKRYPKLLHLRDDKNQTILSWAISQGHHHIVTFINEQKLNNLRQFPFVQFSSDNGVIYENNNSRFNKLTHLDTKNESTDENIFSIKKSSP